MTKMRFFAYLIAILGIYSTANSQENDLVQVEVIKDWTVYKSIKGPSECGIISKPKRTVNRRDGKAVEVRRGEIYLSVTLLPEDSGRQLVSFQAGYPLKKETVVKLSIDGNMFVLIPGTGNNVEWAWPQVGQDQRVVNGLKNGRNAVITGVSHRGTETEDTFSLLGVSKGLETAEECLKQF